MVSERAKRQRAHVDRKEIERREEEWRKWERKHSLFPSTVPGDRGACSPLSVGKVGIGGLAKKERG
jgi:hypothetical protein